MESASLNVGGWRRVFVGCEVLDGLVWVMGRVRVRVRSVPTTF